MLQAVALLASLLAQAGQEEGHPPPAEPARPPQETSWDLETLPDRNIYPPYLADPRASRTATKVTLPVDPAKGNLKIENILGGTRPLALWKDPGNPDEEAELFIEAAVFSRFDFTQDWDLDGADYRFGFPFAYRYGDVAMKLHLWHLTSHLGDEYMTRNPEAKRDSYHLDELALGLSWQATPTLRVYGEIGYALYAGPATEEGRVQLGMECVALEPWKGSAIPYVAVDLSTREEIDWNWNLTAQGGLMFRSKSGSGGLRFLLEYYRGSDQQTQFKSDKEHYFAFGVAADL